ncbi:PLP-dependent aminotransferase family protein [Benzoatithermus flavus]|uniref:PLP-dependent aminotransferase family protein n=1 Tax=Benzoatithermus flavus TaxID=3108223 RepID=A0ABU8XYG0_9PROT
MAPRVDHALWDRLFARTAATGWPLQARLREMVAAAISEGWLVPGTPLPSSRELAENLGVARNTVLLAYQQLVDEELLESRERSGYFVRRRPETGQPSARPARATGTLDWEHRFAIRPSAQRNIVKPHDWLSYPYPFVYGQFDPTLFPTNDWRECARQALSVLEIRGWAPDLIDGDDPQLVEQIRTRVLPRRGIWASAEEIVITLGAQQALYMLAQLLARPGMTVGIEDPGYPDARNILTLCGAELRPVPVDEVGVVPDAIPPACELLFVTPTRQCPTGAMLPLARRERLLALAEAYDLLLLEDDYESNFGLSSDALPTLKSLDRSGRVLYVGSLSKTLAPGLRFGYIVAAPEVAREVRALRRLILRHAPANNQRALALFLALGHFDRLLRKVTTVLAERATVMRAALARHLSDFTYSHGTGGSSFWVHGPEGLDARALARRAAAAGLLIEAGDVFFMSPTPPLHHFRLGFSSLPTERIEPGIAALARLVREPG